MRVLPPLHILQPWQYSPMTGVKISFLALHYIPLFMLGYEIFHARCRAPLHHYAAVLGI